MTRIIDFVKASWRSNGMLLQLFHGLTDTQVNELLERAARLLEVNGKTLGQTCEELVAELTPLKPKRPN